ncbi:nitroreductase family protein [Rhizobium daejeonense]
MTITVNSRTATHPIEPVFLNRWSPRAFTGEPIAEPELLSLLEAGRWAPSAFNAQPWHFIYARRDTPAWEKLLGLLNDFNRSWAQAASALVVVASKTTLQAPGAAEETPSYTHSFDAGAAWGAIALQAAYSGWQAHGMAGFDHERARKDLNIPENYRVEMAFAVGRVGDKSILPEVLQQREIPSPRKPLAEIATEGSFDRG